MAPIILLLSPMGNIGFFADGTIIGTFGDMEKIAADI